MKADEWDSIASDYFTEIVSPFAHQSTKKQLLSEIRRHSDKGLKVIELGCGIGTLIHFLSKHFGSVHAIDFSPEMVKEAEKHARKNVTLAVADILEVKGSYDMAVAINSILAPDIRKVEAMMGNVNALLKEGGLLVGVFPAMEGVLNIAMLAYQAELDSGKSRRRARQRLSYKLDEKCYDFLLGLQDYAGRQKFYYGFELDYRLIKAGFKEVERTRLEYPWGASNDGMRFKGKPKPWDWLVVARK
ncbi:MAG: class I SAM-dependent methyltransferase [Nanoarchaeota archaeon]|nr:class I SAM-dependent methyltransferase [Nanoarchaeota archaeon]